MTLLALQDLFRRYREKDTGVWRLGQDPGRTIFFDYGDTVFAQSTHPQDRLTALLVEKGKVTQAQMDYALANLKPGLSIGKNLIEMGFITQRDLLEVAKGQVERIVWGGLAAQDQEPTFEAKELDATVVRLPLNTPQLFLSGVLALQDREGLLELLGPLNQVVVLQGKALHDLVLPPDLAKLPPLLDGTHTLLELSRESQAEPVRLGAFALFLREMGWARLHEMPPLDRHALDLALTPDPEPLSPPLQEALPETVPSLFATIQEAARPTTNLEHLSQALDEVTEPPPPVTTVFQEELEQVEPPPPPPEPVYVPEAIQPILEPEVVEEPEALAASTFMIAQEEPPPLTRPVEELPEEPRVLLTVPMDEPESEAAPAEPAPDAPPGTPGAGLRRLLVAALALVCLLGAAFGYRAFRARRARTQVMKAIPMAAPAAPAAPKPEPVAEAKPEAVPEAQPETKPETKPEAKPEAKPDAKPAAKPEPPPKAVSATVADRLQALAKGDLTLAVRQGEQRAKDIPAGHWALRL